MKKKTKVPADIAEAWYVNADKVEKEMSDPGSGNDPRWLRKNAVWLKQRGRKKERAAEHKLNQRPKHRPCP